MTDQRATAIHNDQMQKGVFQPSKAEIAREMKSRLYLGYANENELPRIDSPDLR